MGYVSMMLACTGPPNYAENVQQYNQSDYRIFEAIDRPRLYIREDQLGTNERWTSSLIPGFHVQP